MLQVMLHHLVRNYPSAPSTVTHRPKKTTPVPTLQLRELFEKLSPASTFQPAHKLADGQRGRVLHMKMDVVPTYYALQYFHVFGITHLAEKITAAILDIATQNLVPIFGALTKVIIKIKNCLYLYLH